MHTHKSYTPEQLRYLKLLSLQYPTVQSAGAEIIRLKTILNLPKGPIFTVNMRLFCIF